MLGKYCQFEPGYSTLRCKGRLNPQQSLCNEMGFIFGCLFFLLHPFIHSFVLGTKPQDKQETGKVKICLKGGSPGLVVMGNDSCLRGCWFESERHILDGNFFIDTVLL